MTYFHVTLGRWISWGGGGEVAMKKDIENGSKISRYLEE